MYYIIVTSLTILLTGIYYLKCMQYTVRLLFVINEPFSEGWKRTCSLVRLYQEDRKISSKKCKVILKKNAVHTVAVVNHKYVSYIHDNN